MEEFMLKFMLSVMGPGPSGHTQGSVSALVLRFENCWFRD